MGCTLMSVCWIGGQLCYNGLRAIRNREVNPCLEEFWVTLCCGHSSLQQETRDKVVGKQWIELDDSLQHRRDQVGEEVTWVDEESDTCEEVRMLMTDDMGEVDDDMVSRDYLPEKRERAREV